jgi:hypothetical protein
MNTFNAQGDTVMPLRVAGSTLTISYDSVISGTITQASNVIMQYRCSISLAPLRNYRFSVMVYRCYSRRSQQPLFTKLWVGCALLVCLITMSTSSFMNPAIEVTVL